MGFSPDADERARPADDAPILGYIQAGGSMSATGHAQDNENTCAGMNPQSSKSVLRKAIIARRKALDGQTREQAGQDLARTAKPLLRPLACGATVAAYVSMGSEIPTRPLLDMLLAAGCRILVPRLGAGLDIGWGELVSTTDLHDVGAPPQAPRDGTETHRRNRPVHRPQEPNGAVLGAQALSAAALIILPALAVDRDGTRLGRGGGWYDRALRSCTPSARTAAVCWPWEISDRPLPREPHDIPVDAILTPETLITLD